MTMGAWLLAQQARVEPQNGWLWLVMLAVVVVLFLFAAFGWLRYRDSD
jgi:hypothetical protein